MLAIYVEVRFSHSPGGRGRKIGGVSGRDRLSIRARSADHKSIFLVLVDHKSVIQGDGRLYRSRGTSLRGCKIVSHDQIKGNATKTINS